jgi:hypothetical protein
MALHVHWRPASLAMGARRVGGSDHRVRSTLQVPRDRWQPASGRLRGNRGLIRAAVEGTPDGIEIVTLEWLTGFQERPVQSRLS